MSIYIFVCFRYSHIYIYMTKKYCFRKNVFVFLTKYILKPTLNDLVFRYIIIKYLIIMTLVNKKHILSEKQKTFIFFKYWKLYFCFFICVHFCFRTKQTKFWKEKNPNKFGHMTMKIVLILHYHDYVVLLSVYMLNVPGQWFLLETRFWTVWLKIDYI